MNEKTKKAVERARKAIRSEESALSTSEFRDYWEEIAADAEAKLSALDADDADDE